MLHSFFKANVIEVGCDEAGRGCLAGPVVAAAVIFDPDYQNPHLRDSKKLDAKARAELSIQIKQEARSWGIASVDPQEIDRINILQASIKAMHLSIGQLDVKPEFLIIDGNYFLPYEGIPHQCIIKGDDKYLSIAAASVLAKHYRDETMRSLSLEYPSYQWHSNKGYPTIAHKKAIWEHGLTPYHRKSFNWRPTPKQLELSGL